MLPDFFEAHGQQTLPNRIKVVQSLIASCGESCEMLEVGSWTGHGAICWRGAIEKLPKRGRLTCVDPWVPYIKPWDLQSNADCREMQDWLEAGKAYDLFLRNTAYGDFATKIVHFRATLEEAAHRLPKFDLIYIDGSHYFEDVARDIEIARTLLKRGGTLCGDDLERQMDEVDEQEVMSNLDKDYTGSYHPGVTAAVWQAFGRVPTTDAVWHLRGD